MWGTPNQPPLLRFLPHSRSLSSFHDMSDSTSIHSMKSQTKGPFPHTVGRVVSSAPTDMEAARPAPVGELKVQFSGLAMAALCFVSRARASFADSESFANAVLELQVSMSTYQVRPVSTQLS